MSVYFGGSEVLVTEHVLEYAHINAAVLVHQRRGCMAQLVAGVSLCAQTDFFKVLVHHRLNGLDGHPAVVAADKQRVFILYFINRAYTHVVVDRVDAGGVEIDDALLVALAEHTDRAIVADIGVVQPRHLRNTQTAVEKEGDNGVVALAVLALDGVKQLDALFEREILGESFFRFWNFKLLNGIFFEIMFFSR